jgi:hypothetical protein
MSTRGPADMCFRKVVGLLVAASLLAGIAPATALRRVAIANRCFSQTPRPLSILFIGNSLTYFNNMPKMVSEIARANDMQIAVGLVASGGETFHEHIISGDYRETLRLRRWDYVVLQEQSGFGDTYLREGVFASSQPTDGLTTRFL